VAWRTLTSLIAGAAIVGLVLTAPSHAHSASYSNDKYGFSAKLPVGLTVCTTPQPGSDHGFALLLRPGSCERHEPTGDWIGVYAAYDIVHEARSTTELAEALCGDASVMHNAISVGGLVFDTCEKVTTGGSRELDYVALRTKSRQWTDISVEMLVTVYCRDPRRLTEYRKIAERVLRSFVFW
jgi:hypothetical protein